MIFIFWLGNGGDRESGRTGSITFRDEKRSIDRSSPHHRKNKQNDHNTASTRSSRCQDWVVGRGDHTPCARLAQRPLVLSPEHGNPNLEQDQIASLPRLPAPKSLLEPGRTSLFHRVLKTARLYDATTLLSKRRTVLYREHDLAWQDARATETRAIRRLTFALRMHAAVTGNQPTPTGSADTHIDIHKLTPPRQKTTGAPGIEHGECFFPAYAVFQVATHRLHTCC